MRLLFKDASRRRFSLSSVGWMVFGFTICYVIAIQYYRHASSRDPSSYFFDRRHAYDKIYSAKRIEEVKAFLAITKDVEPPISHKDVAPLMCIGVATVARRGQQYVHLTVGSLLAGLDPEKRKDIYLNLLVGHTDPNKHPLLSEPWMRLLPNKVLKYDFEGPDWETIKAWEDGGWYRNKTIYDYTYLLKDCYTTGAQYIAIFEDDTLAMANWFPQAERALSNVEAAMKDRSKDQRWIYLRLFYSDDLLGWNSEEWPTYLFWSVVVWLSTIGIFLFLKNRFGRTIDLHLSNRALAGTTTVLVALTITLHFLAGRHTTHPLPRGIHEMNKYGCCSQGFVFPRSIIPDLLSRTDLTTDWLVDMMIEKIADQQGWIRWATVPSLIQHIGATSSKGYGFDDNAKKLWNFGFEEWTG